MNNTIQDILSEIEGHNKVLCLLDDMSQIEQVLEKTNNDVLYYPFGFLIAQERLVCSKTILLEKYNKIIYSKNRKKHLQHLNYTGAILESFEDKYTK